LMSDGECQEGSVWEAAMMAPTHRVDNLIAIVDYNKWQATGRSDEIASLAPLVDKWRAFGWNAVEVNGHDIPALLGALGAAEAKSGRPSVLVAHTVKGKGVSFMENRMEWHYLPLNAEQYTAAMRELDDAEPLKSA